MCEVYIVLVWSFFVLALSVHRCSVYTFFCSGDNYNVWTFVQVASIPAGGLTGKPVGVSAALPLVVTNIFFFLFCVNFCKRCTRILFFATRTGRVYRVQ